jgi:hypothetical protein
MALGGSRIGNKMHARSAARRQDRADGLAACPRTVARRPDLFGYRRPGRDRLRGGRLAGRARGRRHRSQRPSVPGPRGRGGDRRAAQAWSYGAGGARRCDGRRRAGRDAGADGPGAAGAGGA